MRVVFVSEGDRIDGVSLVDEFVNTGTGLRLMSGMGNTVFVDSEASSTDFMKDPLIVIQVLCGDLCLIIDCLSVDISAFKDEFEKRRLVMHNAKNDLCFLYKVGIYPKRVWCTMVIERLLAYGLPVQLGLENLVEKYTGETITKENKGKIVYEFSDDSISYCINDVKYLPKIYEEQKRLVDKNRSELASILENGFVPVLAYMEYCGVGFDRDMWSKVIEENDRKLKDSIEDMNGFVYRNFKNDGKLCAIDMQGDLFEGFKETKKCFVKWNSDSSISQLYEKCTPDQSAELDSLLKKYRTLHGVTKTYGKVYFSFISGDGRIHPRYKQITAEGRISCPQKGYSRQGYETQMPSFMNLPNDSMYRKSVVADDGNILIGADWSAHEVCIAAYMSKDKAMMDMVNSGMNVHDEMFSVINGSVPDSEYKRLYDHRKQLNLMICYLGTDYGISEKFGCDKDTAAKIIRAYQRKFDGLARYQVERTENIIYKGSIAFNDLFGYRMYIQEIERMRKVKGMFNKTFWKNFPMAKKNFPNSPVVLETLWYQKEKAKLQRLAVQGPISNTGSIMFKYACINLMRKIREEGLFGTVKIVIPQHDSITIECPERMESECRKMLEEAMRDGCEKVCPGLNINIKMWSGKMYR